MSIFKNIFLTIGSGININFDQLVNVRRAKMKQEGYNIDNINWEHYAKVLRAKHEILKAS